MGKYADPSQLTQDLEGTLPYDHTIWIEMRCVSIFVAVSCGLGSDPHGSALYCQIKSIYPKKRPADLNLDPDILHSYIRRLSKNKQKCVCNFSYKIAEIATEINIMLGKSMI